MKTYITTDLMRELLADYQSGMTVAQVAKKHSMSQSGAYYILRKMNGYVGRKRHAVQMHNQYADRNRQIVEDYRNGVTAIELAEKNNISRARIYMILSQVDGYRTQKELGYPNKKHKKGA